MNTGAAAGPDDEAETAATTAVVAHGLLGSMAVISGAAETLRENWTDLNTVDRDGLLSMIETHSVHVAVTLADLARGLSPEVTEVLDRLDRTDRSRS